MRDLVVYTLMFSAMLQLLMAFYAWGRRNEPAATPLIILFLLGFVWAFTYGLDIASSDLPSKIFWKQIGWTAASFGPLVFMMIVFEHLGLKHLLTRVRLVLLLIPVFVSIALIWTIRYHNLLLYDFSVERVGALDILQQKNGILFTPIMLILQGISLVTYYYLIRSLSTANLIKRQQSITILAALLIPFIAFLPSLLNISPIKGFDFTPHALVFTSGLFAIAIFRYGWLDILPLARTILVEFIPLGVVVLDSRDRIVDINPSARDLLQVDNSIIGQEAQAFFSRFEEILRPQAGMEADSREIKLVMPIGQPRYIDVSVIPLKTGDGQFNGRILTFQDVTERKLANERLQAQLTEIESLQVQLHDQAIRDHLTGLYNRGYLNSMLDQESHRARRHQHPLSMLMIEIDDFKKFNDTFGHEAGDVTLQKVAELIQANTRADDIACRFGGDEFTLLLPETPLESARLCAERICSGATNLDLQYDGKHLGTLSLSIGVATFPDHGNSGPLTLRASDKAMYSAKQTGKNRVVVAQRA